MRIDFELFMLCLIYRCGIDVLVCISAERPTTAGNNCFKDVHCTYFNTH